MAANDELTNRLITHRVDVMRFGENAAQRAVATLTGLERELSQRIQEADIAGATNDSVKMRRLEKLRAATQATIDSAYARNTRMLHRDLEEIVALEQQSEQAALDMTFRTRIADTVYTPAQLKKVVRGSFIQGSPAAEWWSTQSVDLKRRFTNQLRIGTLAGDTNDQLVRRLRGVPTQRDVPLPGGGNTRLYRGGLMDMSKREATTLVRTGVQTMANKTSHDMHKANADLLRGEYLQVTLDGRTSDICMSLSGAAWDLEGNPLPESTVTSGFPGPPPYHFNCRSVLVPITKSWDDLMEEAGTPTKRKLDKVPSSTQASLDGQVPGNLTYEKWLKTKSTDFQKETLGPGRYKLWNDGKITLRDLVSPELRPLTLRELKQRAGS